MRSHSLTTESDTQAQQKGMSEGDCGQECCAGYHKVNNHCKECPVGKVGGGCEDDCPPGYFGRMCSNECICSGYEICSPMDGTCRISNSSNFKLGADGGEAASIVLSHTYLVILSSIVCVTVIVIVAMVLFRKKQVNVTDRVNRRPTRSQQSRITRRRNMRQVEIDSPLEDDQDVYDFDDFDRVSNVYTDEMLEDTAHENKTTGGPGFSIFRTLKQEREASGGETSKAVMGMDGYHFMEIVPGRERDTHI